MTTYHPLEILFKHNLWANLRLLDACQDLSKEQLDHKPEGTYGSILETLRHIVGAEEYYIFHITAGEVDLKAKRSVGEPTFADIQKRTEISGKAILDLATSAKGKELVWVGSDEDAFQISIEALLLQALHHASEHRTQIETTLGQMGLETPGLSGWRFYEEEIRE
jgi:uncharacterized damage-inducible protein DinB